MRFRSGLGSGRARSASWSSGPASSCWWTVLFISCSLTLQVCALCPDIIPRRRWGASSSTAVRYITFPVNDLVVGHTASEACSNFTTCARQVHSIQQQHKNADFGDIGYGFLIGGDGLIFEGRGWHKEGAHTYGYNKKSIGVAFIGDFSDSPASSNQINALRGLISCGIELGELSQEVRVFGQRQVQTTESPGLALYQQLQDLPQWVEVP